MIAIPTLDGWLHATTVLSLQEVWRACASKGWHAELVTRMNDPNIARARNVLASTFLDHPEFDELLWVDADVGWRPPGFTQLMLHDLDLVGAIYPARVDGGEWTIRELHPGEAPVIESNGLVEVEGLGCGMLRMRRRAVERLAQGVAVFSDPTAPGIQVREIFQMGLIDGDFWGEDYLLCKRWRELGGKVWADPHVMTVHTGAKSFIGRLADVLAPGAEPLVERARGLVGGAFEA